MFKTDLLRTKLYPPPRPNQWVHRPELSQRLHEGLRLKRQVTLVSAPAGFGKTTCVSEWVNTSPCAHTWFALDAGDDDPVRFFRYFIAALQKIDANLGREIEGVLRAGQLPPAEVISTVLINDVLQFTDRFLLVLDDFHLIQDRFILQVLQQLLTNFPPPLHLVLITREDPVLPLARLRASNKLTEVRARDLRFTDQEAGRFLNEVLALSLSKADIAALESKTEGWIAGLQLAALSIRDQSDPSPFITALSGSHRPILGYLTEQVLDQQPQEIREFLLQTAVLDRLNGDLCDEVCQRSDSHTLLERLFSANLFLIALDDEGQWYRYHHMFADLLRDRQRTHSREEAAELHRRASHWYAREGMAGVAVEHALAADDFELAVKLLERHALSLIMQGYAKTVNGWVQAIPGQWQFRSPRTNLAQAWMHLLRGAYAEAPPYLERLEGVFSDSQLSVEDRQSLKAEWLVMKSLLLNRQGKASESLALVEEALGIAPEWETRVRSLVYFGLAFAYETNAGEQQAMDTYQKAIQYSRAADDLVVEMLSTSGLCRLAFEKGRLHLAHEIATAMSERIARSASLPPISTVIYGVLAEVYYHWGELAPAHQHGQQALQLSILGGYRSGLIGCRVFLSRLLQLEGDLLSAAAEIQQAAEELQVDTPDYVRQEAIAQQARVFLERDRLASAQMALQSEGFFFQDRFAFPDFPPEKALTHARGLLVNSSLRILMYQARSSRDPSLLRQGMPLVDQVIAAALQGQNVIVALEALLIRAQMHAELEDYRASQADYARALELAEPEGFSSVFVESGSPVVSAVARLARQGGLPPASTDFVERILTSAARLPKREEAVAEMPLVEPLSERELEVLRLMAGGLKYKEIASRLTISLNTVRFHVKAIYGKLNANNRTQAIETARRLQIL